LFLFNQGPAYHCHLLFGVFETGLSKDHDF
jgi:hypothetical protein